MPPSPKHSRRWLQFGIGTMLLLVTVFAVWLGWELKFIRERDAMLKWTLGNGGIYSPAEGVPHIHVPWWRSLLGDVPVNLLFLPGTSSGSDVARAKHLFPEAEQVINILDPPPDDDL